MLGLVLEISNRYETNVRNCLWEFSIIIEQSGQVKLRHGFVAEVKSYIGGKGGSFFLLGWS